MSRFGACSARISGDTQTHRTTTVTLAAHARRGLIIIITSGYTKLNISSLADFVLQVTRSTHQLRVELSALPTLSAPPLSSISVGTVAPTHQSLAGNITLPAFVYHGFIHAKYP